MIITRVELKKLIMEVLSEETDGLVTTIKNTSITAELAKNTNRGLPITKEEFDKISEAIKTRVKELHSIDKNDQVHEITFTRNEGGNNFYYKLRKVADPTDPTKQSFMYVIWIVPFTSRIDIGKPTDLIRRESNLFNQQFDSSKIMDILFNFVRDAMLINL
jgi:hypothetical protein